ncbi:MAG: RHS repeat domain-containing protein, partial [Aridibacter sp.]
ETSDPYTTETNTFCESYEFNYPECEYDGQMVYVGDHPQYLAYCSGTCTQYSTYSVYDFGSIFRGNLTKTTSYADAQNLTGAVVENRTYDVTGNMVTSSSSCCELNTINYNSTTQYAYPVSQTRGSASVATQKNTASAVYDYNTGLVTQTTDANGRTDTSTYDANTLRPTQQTSSTGAYTQYTYNESAMTVTSETKESNGALASKSIQYLNGIGQVVREEALGAGGVWDIVETKYTNLGQVWKQTRPYRAGQTLQWSENFYDIQGRTIKTQGADGSYTQAFYNEATRPGSASTASGQTTRVMDAWGRERWGRYNAQGNLAEVVEPNPDGNGTVTASGNMVTSYSYDALNRLTQTNQGGQLRSFKYDDLSRLTRQKLSEKTATLNDAGTYVGSGGSGANWSDAFWYDNRSNMIQKTDARGVKSLYSYQSGGADDPLNRIQSVSYDLSGPRDTSMTVYAAASVSYQYLTTGDKERINKVITNGVSTEDYLYDVEGRVSEYKQTLDNRTSYPMTTNYTYDTLSRIVDVRYPAQYGLAGSPRKLVNHSYDVASRVLSLKVDGQEQAGNIVFDASSQTTSIKIGPTGTNQVTETYAYDDQTGLLTNQKVLQGSSALLDLSYDYQRLNSNGSLNGKTGHLTKITNNLNNNKNREYEFDALGRLTKMKGGNNLSTQTYSYDRFGNRTSVSATGVAADNTTMPRDGLTGLTYNTSNNRITSSGFQYDVAGNQIRALAEDGVNWLKFEYDAANRLKYVKQDNGTNIQSFDYGASRQRLISQDYATNQKTIYSGQMAEYTEFTANVPTWTKSYIYFGDTVLSTIEKAGSVESTEFNHPDRLGIRTVTNQATGTSSEQTTLPFGTALNAESTTALSKRFTSYERSDSTGLDYAINRTYDSKQGRFTQVDPIGISATSLFSPQTLNLYTYCGNDPINHVDPDGLFFGSFFKWLGKKLWGLVKRIIYAAVKAAVTALVVLLSGGNLAAAGVAFVAAFFQNLAFPRIGNILTPSWNPNVRHPLIVDTSINRHIIRNLLGDDTFVVPITRKDFLELIQKFFRLYGKDFRRCVWKVFSKDRYGNKSNIAEIMKTPGTKDVPINKITLYKKIPEAQGFVRDKTGEIGLKREYNSTTLRDGTKVSGEEQFFRTFGHEYANYLSWFYTGAGNTFGVEGGIRGDGMAGTGVRSVNVDDDTGARQEKCIWGNTSF